MICDQHKCENEAVGAFVWPGSPALASCAHHLAQVRGLASVFGFELDVRPLEVVILARARDAVERLSSESEP